MATQPDYRIRPSSPAPPLYPAHPSPDSFSEESFLPDYESRRQAFFAHVLRNPAPANTKGIWHELARIAAGGTPHEGVFRATLDFIDARKDCSDFALHGVLRWLCQFNSPNRGWLVKQDVIPINHAPFPDDLLARARATVLNFKYFPNEPGIDSMCTWTENHYILFTSAAYLAGQMFPEDVFENSGETGRQKMDLNRPRILRWLDLRFRSGFSEWLSHVYYDEDLAALLSLLDFADDEEICRRAAIVIDLLLLDMALNSFRGVFGSTHGRAYGNTKRWASQEGTTDTSKLLFGTGIFSGFDNMSAAAFALSSYRSPPAIEAIASDRTRPRMLNRQRMGIRLNEAERWGLEPEGVENGMHLLTLEAYMHRRTCNLTLRMFDAFNWWENAFFAVFRKYRPLIRFLKMTGLLGPLVAALEWDVCRNTREEVDIITCRTPDYMISSAPDYRSGFGGDQQHIWQATFGPNAVCFTTHPVHSDAGTPDTWAGSGLLPRVAQAENVLIAIYHITARPALYVPIRHFYTHAWLPRREFDEAVERDGWYFARRGPAYLALHSMRPARWQAEGENAGAELIADGADNAWICELGSEGEHGSFEAFIQKIAGAGLAFRGLDVTYHSPSQGVLRFGWEGDFTQNGQVVDLHPAVRYENPYARAEFDRRELHISAGGHDLHLDWGRGERLVR